MIRGTDFWGVFGSSTVPGTTLRRHTDAATVAILVASDDGAIGQIDENDPALVRMRARRTMVDLHATDSALPGALGVPLIAHGRLLGVIALGARASGEHVTPDERRSLAEVANGLALALAARAASTTFSVGSARSARAPVARRPRRVTRGSARRPRLAQRHR